MSAKISDVWEYFQKIKNNDDNVVISINCQLCKTEYGALTSTTTLRRHLHSVHNSTYMSNKPVQSDTYTFSEQRHIVAKHVKWIATDL